MAASAQFDRKFETPGASPVPRFSLRHYTVAEIAQLWNLSDDAIRKIFESEPGVLLIGDERSSGRKRRYVTLRIPEDVAARVHRRLARV
jgi:hypothetical protein